MIELYSPANAIELALMKGILDSEDINYYVRNDHFGALKIGPQIELYNKQMIVVQDDQYNTAKELLADFLDATQNKVETLETKYSLFDKIRMIFEVLLFGWFIPGNSKQKKMKE